MNISTHAFKSDCPSSCPTAGAVFFCCKMLLKRLKESGIGQFQKVRYSPTQTFDLK